jgi:hypothetical protein
VGWVSRWGAGAVCSLAFVRRWAAGESAGHNSGLEVRQRVREAYSIRLRFVLPPLPLVRAFFSAWQLSKFLPNATKEQEAYKAQRTKTTMLYDMDAVAGAAGRSGPPTDPIAAALAAHGGSACLVRGVVFRITRDLEIYVVAGWRWEVRATSVASTGGCDDVWALGSAHARAMPTVMEPVGVDLLVIAHLSPVPASCS